MSIRINGGKFKINAIARAVLTSIPPSPTPTTSPTPTPTPTMTPIEYNIIITQDGVELAAQNDDILIT